MNQNIRLTLKKSLIIEAVKGETYIKGRIDNAAAPDGKAHLLAYEEEAGNEEFHERKLQRTMFTALSELKGLLADYVHPVNATSGDNISIESTDDNIIIILVVSDRFNQAQTTPLAHLCAKYIEDNMLNQWWGAFNVNQAQFYAAQMSADTNSISICFNKLAPAVPQLHYTTKVTTLATELTAQKGEDITLTYSIDSGADDDIECISENPFVAIVKRAFVENTFYVKCRNEGVTKIRLFSRHNDNAKRTLDLIVTEKDEGASLDDKVNEHDIPGSDKPYDDDGGKSVIVQG